MRLNHFEKQARRRSIYYVVAFFGILVMGTVFLISILAATKQRVRTHLYHNPEQTLRLVFAQTETKWRYVSNHATYASMETLVDEGLISEEFLLGPVEGYRYRVKSATPTSFVVTAEPEGPAASPEPVEPVPGGRTPLVLPTRPRLYFAVDESHTIRADEKGPANSKSTVVWSPRDLDSR